jgi:hypothetical protein
LAAVLTETENETETEKSVIISHFGQQESPRHLWPLFPLSPHPVFGNNIMTTTCCFMHYAQSWAQRPLSVDPSINRTTLIFHFETVSLTVERLF